MLLGWLPWRKKSIDELVAPKLEADAKEKLDAALYKHRKLAEDADTLRIDILTARAQRSILEHLDNRGSELQNMLSETLRKARGSY